MKSKQMKSIKQLSEMTIPELLEHAYLSGYPDFKKLKGEKKEDMLKRITELPNTAIIQPTTEEGAREIETPVVQMGERKAPAEGNTPAKQIVPIFIGCQSPDVVKMITDYLLKNNADISDNATTDFDIVIMGQEVLESSVNQYFFGRLEKDNQNAYLRQRQDEQLRNATLKKAIDLQQFMQHYLNTKQTDFTFSPTQLKYAASAGLRKEISNSELREVIDLLSVYDFIQPTLLNKPYIKQLYKFTFSDHDMLKNTVWLEVQAKEQIQGLHDQLLMLQTNRQILENKIQLPSAIPINADQTDTDGQNNNGLVQSGTEQLSDAGTSGEAVEAE